MRLHVPQIINLDTLTHSRSKCSLHIQIRNSLPSEEIASTACHMDKWSFLAEGEPCPHSKHHANTLNKQGPCTQVAPNDEPTQNGLYLKSYVCARE